MQLPAKFIERTESLLGEKWEDFVNSLDSLPPTSIRFNFSKWQHSVDTIQSVPWCGSGFYLASRPSFTFDPLFHGGAYYVQEASSMFIEQFFFTVYKRRCKGT